MGNEIKSALDVIDAEEKLRMAIEKSLSEIDPRHKVPDGLFLTMEFWIDKGRVILVKTPIDF